MANPIALVKSYLLGLVRHDGDVTAASVNDLYLRPIHFATTECPASSTVAETGIAPLSTRGKFRGGRYCMTKGTTVAASAVVFAQMDVYAKTGATTTLLYTISSSDGAFAAGTSLALTASSANLIQASTATLCYAWKTSGACATTYAGTCTLLFEEMDEA